MRNSITGEPSEYRCGVTVMGDMRRGSALSPERILQETAVPAFSPCELAMLNPNLRTQKYTTSTKPTEYEISYAPGGLYGVRVALPSQHVLRDDPIKADSLFFSIPPRGLREDVSREEAYGASFDLSKVFRHNVIIFAVNGKQLTQLTGTGLGLCRRSGDDSMIIYRDTELDLLVTAKDRTLTFGSLSSAWAQNTIDDIQKQVDKYNATFRGCGRT